MSNIDEIITFGNEIDLLSKYPKPKRNLDKRKESKTEEDRKIAREFDQEFFDGDRKRGYGGFSYNQKFWGEVVKDFYEYYKLNNNSSILDVGCAKGFMIYDFLRFNKELKVQGIDISEYAIKNAKEEVKDLVRVGNAKDLPYEDNSFDLVISINTIHNLDSEECAVAIREINRVSKKFSYITVDAYRNSTEKKNVLAWNLTAKTIKSTLDWKAFFKKLNYNGDYYWFMP